MVVVFVIIAIIGFGCQPFFTYFVRTMDSVCTVCVVVIVVGTCIVVNGCCCCCCIVRIIITIINIITISPGCQCDWCYTTVVIRRVIFVILVVGACVVGAYIVVNGSSSNSIRSSSILIIIIITDDGVVVVVLVEYQIEPFCFVRTMDAVGSVCLFVIVVGACIVVNGCYDSIIVMTNNVIIVIVSKYDGKDIKRVL